MPETLEMTEIKKKPVGKYIAIGCSSLLLLAVIAGVLIFYGFKQFISNVTVEYTEDTPLEMPEVQASPSETEEVLERVEKFTRAVENNQPAPPLELTSRELNILLQNHPSLKMDVGHVTIKDDTIYTQASIPLDEFGERFQGRYLNGVFVLRLGLSDGSMNIFIKDVLVAGKPLPKHFMMALRGENLGQAANENPEIGPFLRKLQSITVQDGIMTIRAKKSM